MDSHQKLVILQRDLQFLQEEHTNSKELLDALHPGVSYILHFELNARVEQLQLSIDRKKIDVKSILEEIELGREQSKELGAK